MDTTVRNMSRMRAEEVEERAIGTVTAFQEWEGKDRVQNVVDTHLVLGEQLGRLHLVMSSSQTSDGSGTASLKPNNNMVCCSISDAEEIGIV